MLLNIATGATTRCKHPGRVPQLAENNSVRQTPRSAHNGACEECWPSAGVIGRPEQPAITRPDAGTAGSPGRQAGRSGFCPASSWSSRTPGNTGNQLASAPRPRVTRTPSGQAALAAPPGSCLLLLMECSAITLEDQWGRRLCRWENSLCFNTRSHVTGDGRTAGSDGRVPC